jgi:hypothetical protein
VPFSPAGNITVISTSPDEAPERRERRNCSRWCSRTLRVPPI